MALVFVAALWLLSLTSTIVGPLIAADSRVTALREQRP